MASCSSSMYIVDDDDEFDWAAAVQEIDVACQATTAERPSTSNLETDFQSNMGIASNPVQEVDKKERFGASYCSVSSARQSTLDRFIGTSSSGSKKLLGKADVSNREHGNNGNFDTIGDRDGGDDIDYEGIEMINGVVKIDSEAAKTWVYPVNVPHRDYQFSITKTALFSNTLVVLPTGLGKTLIAAVVMYNYFRWFPEGKIVFAAPSRPLVMQQIEACHNIVGIPQEWAIDLTGQTSPARRAEFWKTKRVFFVTPQVLEKDIHSGSCMVRHLVCLVIDEAHRAMGNYSYCVAVRELMDTPVQLRILALTATPGSKQQTIQHIIDNLQISTLEYRNESDSDVLPYVHERKIELMEVAMGKEADEVNNLLLEVVRPFVIRLSALGVMQNRDFQTLSPCDLLNSRDKFRQEPPASLPHTKYGEIEGYFGVLITLYHVRKLLSSHGIRPAFEMLDEKMKQGSFARLMSRNEALLKAKILMQQTVTHGAPSPKLAKMLEVLTDHFKVKDPKTSRVIIFSNFRGSVRDILSALTNIGDVVKATEFIGQSSGKTLKGQSQKVQQAVLQKFRAGGYNVIVATSIGEEGLDIMEVDLVICFDANVSPLRMIQRMGRTGRKHQGRVVVLACEGSELKGYMRKQANGKAIKKHLRNNGMNSFNFHPSPRMVPHVFRPIVQYLEMSIEEFVPRGKKVKDDNLVSIPAYETALTDAETDLLAKYFSSTGVEWRPSLIAFPHFQAFPSPVNKVIHSNRTGMLIDVMQSLQGLIFSDDKIVLQTEGGDSLNDCLKAGVAEPHDPVIEGKFNDPAGENQKIKDLETLIEAEETSEEMHTQDYHKQAPYAHSFLFDPEFVSVDNSGNVLVLSLPKLPLECHTHTESDLAHAQYHFIEDSEDPEESILHVNTSPSILLESNPCSPVCEKEKQSGEEEVLCTPVSARKSKHDESVMPMLDDPSNDLSPRLTNFIKSGVVPESPLNASGVWEDDRGNIKISPVNSSPNPQIESTCCWNGVEKAVQDGSSSKLEAWHSTDNDNRTPVPLWKDNAPGTRASPMPISEEMQTPLVEPKQTSSSSGKDWLFDSGVKPEIIEQQCRLKRLRKQGDLNRKCSTKSKDQTGKRRISRTGFDTKPKLAKGEGKHTTHVAAYIEEEAEVSPEVAASEDEEDGEEGSSYEDSFIDDSVNTTSAATQAGGTGTDMMAIYRRSLLSQSPFPRPPNLGENFSPDSVVQIQSSRMDGTRSPLSGPQHITQTPQTGLDSTAHNLQPGSQLGIPTTLESRKRKLSYYEAQLVPVVNLDQAFKLLHDAPSKSSPDPVGMDMVEETRDEFDDDEFYQGIDLDAVEEAAAKLLKFKSESSAQKTAAVPEPPPIQLDIEFLGSPSFDLGF